MANDGTINRPPRAATSVTICASCFPIVVALVEPIAVGGFDQQDVRLADRRGIGKDRPSVAAEIAAEQNRSCRRPARERRKTQQMSRVDEFDFYTGDDWHGAVVANRLQPVERASGIDLRVERLRGDVLRVAVLVRLPRILFLNVRRIREHERAQVVRARSAEDAAPKALADQPRQVPTVIEMRMREDDRVDPRRLERKRRPVAMPQLFEPLKEAAVDEKPVAADIEEML